MKTLLALCLLASSLAVATQPNVILLMGDDHGWEETGYNGHPHVKTPVLDAMAKHWPQNVGAEREWLASRKR